MTYNHYLSKEDDDLKELYKTLTTNDIRYQYIDVYPTDFDVKEIDEDLNTCDKCGIIVISETELYWQGTGGDYYHYGMDKIEVDALCDDCHHRFCIPVKYKKTKKDIEEEKKYGEPLLLCYKKE